MIRYACTAQPAAEPVSVSDLRAWARLDDNGDDAVLTRMLLTARRRVELHTRRALISQTWTATLDRWPALTGASEGGWPFVTSPSTRRIDLSPEPVQSITSVAVDGTTIASSHYRLVGGELIVKSSVADSLDELGGGIVITYRAGYGDAASAVPDGLREAILMLATEAYERRGEPSEAMLTAAPDGAAAKMQPYIVMRL